MEVEKHTSDTQKCQEVFSFRTFARWRRKHWFFYFLCRRRRRTICSFLRSLEWCFFGWRCVWAVTRNVLIKQHCSRINVTGLSKFSLSLNSGSICTQSYHAVVRPITIYVGQLKQHQCQKFVLDFGVLDLTQRHR